MYPNKHKGRQVTFSERISEVLIRFFIHPGRRRHPVHFKTKLRNAAKVLVSSRSADPAAVEVISRITSLFPRKGTVVLMQQPDNNSGEPKPASDTQKSFTLQGVNRKSLWYLARSDKLRVLMAHQFELFIDLDPEFNLLNYYLCRRLKAPVRIGFKKKLSPSYYNLEYKGASTDYVQNLEGLHTFLKTFF